MATNNNANDRWNRTNRWVANPFGDPDFGEGTCTQGQGATQERGPSQGQGATEGQGALQAEGAAPGQGASENRRCFPTCRAQCQVIFFFTKCFLTIL